MLSIIGFLVILGPLVIFHEFGHFIFARIFGVKAETFSVGFGPKIWSRQMGETELRLAAIPLGGFVKLLGEEGDGEEEIPASLRKRTLQAQAPWKRFLIFFGGPLFNFILAIFIFAFILVVGEPQVSSKIGRVTHGSLAERMGFRSGDRILSVDGVPVRKYEEVMLRLNETGAKPLVFDLERPESARPGARMVRLQLEVQPGTKEGFSIYGEQKSVGELSGIFPHPRSTEVGISNPASPAGKAGVETADRVASFDGVDVDTWEKLEALYAETEFDKPVAVAFERGPAEKPTRKFEATFTKPKRWRSLGDDWGLHSTELFVEQTVEDSPARKAGVVKSDRLVSVNGKSMESFFELKDSIQKAGEESGGVKLVWERGGQRLSAQIAPMVTNGRDVVLRKTQTFTVGVMPMLTWREADMVIERVWNPFVLLYRSVERTATLSWRNLVSIKKMITGDVSVATLGGPILIGKIAGESITRGFVSFFTTMAVLSVGLGILNLLPIPVLDGGHLLLLGIEAIRRKPLSLRQREIIQQVGLSLILLLMVVVIRNDLTRLPIFH